MKYVDALINSITMYRLTLYGLLAMALWALLLGVFGFLSYTAVSLASSLFIVLFVSYGANELMAKFLRLPVNTESEYITALILFFILPPVVTLEDAGIVALSVLGAMATKYFFVFRRKHLFNPAAAGAFIMSLVFGLGATWWVGSLAMLPITFFVGFLIVRKIHRFPMVLTFFAAAALTIGALGVQNGATELTADGVGQLLLEILTSWPVIFFGMIMLTEPFTAPATRPLQMTYAGIVGVLFGSSFHIGPIYATPEFALLVGNLFTACVTPAPRLFLTFKERIQVTPDTYHFRFAIPHPFRFTPGQYMEWMLPHIAPDLRGTRRYFTVASAPSEKTLDIGVKIGEKSSTFKRALLGLQDGSLMVAAQLAGDFTLPREKNTKLVFIAGGIGITPFRSMVRALLDKKERRDITLLYAANSPADFAYKDVWNEAAEVIGLKTVYVATRAELCPPDWDGCTGYITPEMILREVPDYRSRTFYISGPGAMVHAYQELLAKIGVSKTNIVTDYFPGF